MRAIYQVRAIYQACAQSTRQVRAIYQVIFPPLNPRPANRLKICPDRQSVLLGELGQGRSAAQPIGHATQPTRHATYRARHATYRVISAPGTRASYHARKLPGNFRGSPTSSRKTPDILLSQAIGPTWANRPSPQLPRFQDATYRVISVPRRRAIYQVIFPPLNPRTANRQTICPAKQSVPIGELGPLRPPSPLGPAFL